MVTKKKLTKEEWEAMTGTDMSFILPSDGNIETALESSLNDTEETFSGRIPESLSSGSENRRPQACIC